KNGCGGSNGVRNSDESFLRDMAPRAARKGEDGRAKEREAEADPIRPTAMRVHAGNNCDGGSEGRNLGKRKVHKDNAALNDVHAQVGVNPREDEACDKRRK